MKKSCSLLLILTSITLFGCSSASSVNQDVAAEKQSVTPTPSTSSTFSPAVSPKTREYSKSLDELRASFNRDKGKVRLITLLSPT